MINISVCRNVNQVLLMVRYTCINAELDSNTVVCVKSSWEGCWHFVPKVSIYICTFNRAEMLKESIQSVLNQTYCDIKVVVLDNASTPTLWPHSVIPDCPISGAKKILKAIALRWGSVANLGYAEAFEQIYEIERLL